ncbi:hypothetical protein M432DRAFT_473118 [Thermoascus aurantiacus ATCC 26904]
MIFWLFLSSCLRISIASPVTSVLNSAPLFSIRDKRPRKSLSLPRPIDTPHFSFRGDGEDRATKGCLRIEVDRSSSPAVSRGSSNERWDGPASSPTVLLFTSIQSWLPVLNSFSSPFSFVQHDDVCNAYDSG